MPMFDEETPITEEQLRQILDRPVRSGKNYALALHAKQQEALGNKVVILKPDAASIERVRVSDYVQNLMRDPRDNPFYRRFVLGEFVTEESQAKLEQGDETL